MSCCTREEEREEEDILIPKILSRSLRMRLEQDFSGIGLAMCLGLRWPCFGRKDWLRASLGTWAGFMLLWLAESEGVDL
jgi:hypothetical protein